MFPQPGAPRSLAQENAEDIYFGQEVLVWARWFFAGGLAVMLLALLGGVTEITLTAVVLMLALAVNFFVYTRFLLRQPANQWLLLVLTGFDTALVTALVLFWPTRVGFASFFHVLYYPLVFTFALVFPPRRTLIYTSTILGSYLLICLYTGGPALYQTSGFIDLFARLVTLAAMGGLGTFYWRTQRTRRRSGSAPVLVKGDQ